MKNSALTANIEKALASIFPVYGNKGLDVPSFDKDKHMYLVDQHQFDSGNRSLTYAAIAGNVVAEVVLGHYHGWEYMNKLRVLVLDGQDFKVVATKEWGQSTRMDMAARAERDVTPVLNDVQLFNRMSLSTEEIRVLASEIGKAVAKNMKDPEGERARDAAYIDEVERIVRG